MQDTSRTRKGLFSRVSRYNELGLLAVVVLLSSSASARRTS